MTSPRGRLQPGIHIAGSRPPPCWRLLLLDVVPRTAPAAVGRGLRRLSAMLAALPVGHVRELEGQPADHARVSAEQFAGLTVLIAFGRRLFDAAAHDPPLTAATRPSYLAYLPEDAFGGLPWAEPASGRPRPIGEADIALQLTAERLAGVNCAAVEAWKLIHDEGLPFAIRASFSGFGRHDGRGWLEFHDGVSNLPSHQRVEALSAGPDPPWMAGGTYMAFLRVQVDLAAWRALTRPQQELIVGRDKLSGAGLIGTARDPSGDLVPVAAPVPDPREPEPTRDWIDPPQTTDPVIEASHIHRANQSRATPGAPAAHRMFRQGYDFLEDIGPDGPAAGLNFVSFQRDLQALHHVLHLPGWLGDVSFGGPAAPGPGEPAEPRFLALLAGGLYAVPPRSEPFPGARLFAGSPPSG